MIRNWFVFLSVVAVASPAAAQTQVRLEVEAESWLQPTPFDALREFTARLSEAGIDVVDAPDVPVVRLLYEETAGTGYSPKLVPSTRISFDIEILGPDGPMFQKSRSGIGFPQKPQTNFPSAAELRMLAIAEFRQYQDFALLGHIVGAVLGKESAFGPLLAASEPDWFFARMLIERVPRTAAVDRLVVSPLLAILVLEDYGQASATQILTDLASHPHFGAPAVKALKAIQSR